MCLDGPKCFTGSSDSVFHCRSRCVANQQLKSIASSLASAVCAGRDHNCKPFSDVPWKHRNETWQKCLPVRRFYKGAILMQQLRALWDTTRCTGHASAGVEAASHSGVPICTDVSPWVSFTPLPQLVPFLTDCNFIHIF